MRVFFIFLFLLCHGTTMDLYSDVLNNIGEQNSEQDYFSELEESLESALLVCRGGIDQASENLFLELKLDVEDGIDFNRDSMDQTEHSNEEVEDASGISPSASANTPKYARDLKKLLNTMERACLGLATIIPEPNQRRKRHTGNVMTTIQNSINNWSEKWIPHVENDANIFLESCLYSFDCKSSLEELIEGAKSLLETGSMKGFPFLKSNIPRKDVTSENLSELQKLILEVDYGMSEKDPYYIAEGIDQQVDLMKQLEFLYKIKTTHNSHSSHATGELEIEDSYVVAEIPETFLSFTLGSSIIQKRWQHIPEKKDLFIALASPFSPAILRVGGSAANFLTYDPSSESGERSKGGKADAKWPIYHPKTHKPNNNGHDNVIIHNSRSPFNHPKFESMNYKNDPWTQNSIHDCEPQLEKVYTNFTMNLYDWHLLLNMTETLKWDLLFDLNQFQRNDDGSWDSSNARLIIHDSLKSRIPIIWQLGNEPNSYGHKFNKIISPSQMASDYSSLRDLLNLYYDVFRLDGNRPILVGPDVTRPRHVGELIDDDVGTDSMLYLTDFLKEFDGIDAVTWHQYYMDGRTATLEDYMSIDVMKRFSAQIQEVTKVRDEIVPGKPIWLTETANAWGGGSFLDKTFASTFLWLDKLGAAAFGGVTHVFRQTLYGGCYALMDREMTPTPNYWLSVIHKTTVGGKVLLPRTRLVSDDLRVYAHCLKTNHILYKQGAVVVFGLNVGRSNEALRLYGRDLKQSPLFVYRLSTPEADVTSKQLLLNDRALRVSSSGQLPDLTPEERIPGNIFFRPKEIAFWIIPEANVTFC